MPIHPHGQCRDLPRLFALIAVIVVASACFAGSASAQTSTAYSICTGCTSGNLISQSGSTGKMVDTGIASSNVPLLNGSNAFTNTQNITTSGLNFALNTSQTATGTPAATCATGTYEFPCLDLINIDSDNVNAAAFDALDYVQIHANIGGSSVTGARQVLDVTADFIAPSNVSNPNPEYVSGTFQMNVLSSENGTGGFFAGNFVVRAGGSASSILGFTGIEVDLANASVAPFVRLGLSAVSVLGAQGTKYDEAYHVGSTAGTGATGWLTAFGLSDLNGNAPLDATNGCVICTGGETHTIKTFADLSSYTVIGNILNFKNFLATTSGQLALGLGTTAPAFQLDVLGGNNGSPTRTDGIRVSTDNQTVVRMDTTRSLARNYALALNEAAVGDFGIYQSLSAGGDPLAGGGNRLFYATIAPAIIIGGASGIPVTVTSTLTVAGIASAAQADVVCTTSAGLLTYQVSATGCAVSGEQYKNMLPPLQRDEVVRVAQGLTETRLWTYKDPDFGDPSEYAGFTAQQVAAIDNRFVTWDPDGQPRAVKYRQLAETAIAGLSILLRDLREEFSAYRSAHP